MFRIIEPMTNGSAALNNRLREQHKKRLGRPDVHAFTSSFRFAESVFRRSVRLRAISKIAVECYLRCLVKHIVLPSILMLTYKSMKMQVARH
jgi:hypothetical protein